jgi:hypothetical protein
MPAQCIHWQVTKHLQAFATSRECCAGFQQVCSAQAHKTPYQIIDWQVTQCLLTLHNQTASSGKSASVAQQGLDKGTT